MQFNRVEYWSVYALSYMQFNHGEYWSVYALSYMQFLMLFCQVNRMLNTIFLGHSTVTEDWRSTFPNIETIAICMSKSVALNGSVEQWFTRWDWLKTNCLMNDWVPWNYKALWLSSQLCVCFFSRFIEKFAAAKICKCVWSIQTWFAHKPNNCDMQHQQNKMKYLMTIFFYWINIIFNYTIVCGNTLHHIRGNGGYDSGRGERGVGRSPFTFGMGQFWS